MAVKSWVCSSLKRIYPASKPERKSVLSIDAALNEKFSFQIALNSDKQAVAPDKAVAAVKAPKGWTVSLRRVGYVPVAHLNTPVEKSDEDCEGRDFLPGLVPDPLFDENSCVLPQGETQAFWVSVIPAKKVKAGNYSVKVEFSFEDFEGNATDRKISHEVKVKLYDFVIKPRKNFAVTNWFYHDCLIDWYKTDLFDKRYWELVEKYLKNIGGHGQDTIYTSMFSVPLDGNRPPAQLLKIKKKGDKYSFDWSDVRRFVKLAKKAGIKYFEWTHLFSQWGVKHALKIYEGQGKDGKLLWKEATGATSKTYKNFLSQFLPSFHSFLKKEKLLNKSFFHLSDEPHTDEDVANYQKARQVLREYAPWMKVMDAMSLSELGEQGITDMPIGSIKMALEFVEKDIESWCYFCCGPRKKHLNRLMDTPLAKIRMSGWLFYRWPFKGFLHWGYNYWYRCQTSELIDPYSTTDAHNWPGWAYGDTFLVYPGEDGPVDSIRWEVFAESLQDYAILQSAGVGRDSKMLQQLKSFEDFPKTEKWIKETKRKILSGK